MLCGHRVVISTAVLGWQTHQDYVSANVSRMQRTSERHERTHDAVSPSEFVGLFDWSRRRERRQRKNTQRHEGPEAGT